MFNNRLPSKQWTSAIQLVDTKEIVIFMTKCVCFSFIYCGSWSNADTNFRNVQNWFSFFLWVWTVQRKKNVPCQFSIEKLYSKSLWMVSTHICKITVFSRIRYICTVQFFFSGDLQCNSPLKQNWIGNINCEFTLKNVHKKSVYFIKNKSCKWMIP